MSDFDFSPVAIPAESRREYRIPLLGVTLELTAMAEVNEAYWSDFVAIVAAHQLSGGDDGPADVESAPRSRRRDAPLIAKHGIRGWRGVKDRAGVEVPFSPATAERWLLELARTDGAEHLFDDLRRFCKDPDNFTNAAIAGAKALAGNLSGG